MTGTLSDGAKQGGGRNGQDAYTGRILAFGGNRTSGEVDVAAALNAHGGPHGRLDFESETFAVRTAQTGANGHGVADDVAHTIDGAQGQAVAHAAVRRLTPTECERLQGFPDGWTEGGADGPRYAALGDAVTVPVAEWLGRRILAVENA